MLKVPAGDVDAWKRAIVYFFWGASHAQEAIESARSVARLRLPILAITDVHTAGTCERAGVFDECVVVSLPSKSLRAKASLYGLCPPQYDSFLFLDTDTRVTADISFGFASAERFGLAAAMAPHYSLDHFWQFGEELDGLGLPRADQLQYNTGVIFFVRSTTVEVVMRRWKHLADTVAPAARHSDQPFFTAALEQCCFNPYTLSPAYNYRGLGEIASGVIRVWHSRAAVPVEVNVDVDSWPARRFVGSERRR